MARNEDFTERSYYSLFSMQDAANSVAAILGNVCWYFYTVVMKLAVLTDS